MKWLVTISALPSRSESIQVESASSIDALRDVMGREMVGLALARHPGASLCISVMKERGSAADKPPGSMPPATAAEGGLELR
jgi:hypothetical protein